MLSLTTKQTKTQNKCLQRYTNHATQDSHPLQLGMRCDAASSGGSQLQYRHSRDVLLCTVSNNRCRETPKLRQIDEEWASVLHETAGFLGGAAASCSSRRDVDSAVHFRGPYPRAATHTHTLSIEYGARSREQGVLWHGPWWGNLERRSEETGRIIPASQGWAAHSIA